jgi:all-trans-8'-apo-beta-carotenal 15,15'-oxygenase
MSLRDRSWNAAMAACPGPLDLEIPASEVVGAIPAALRGGTLWSNGPGWTKIGDRLAHPFDGHGYVRAFRLRADGGCHLSAAFVHTQVYRDEAAAQRLVHRGLATNAYAQFWKNIGFGATRNVANTTILRWGDRMLAGWEGGAPHALDPETLRTVGEETFGGAIAGQATLAHMHRDRRSGRLVLCSVAAGRDTTFTFRELNRHDQVVSARAAPFRGALFTHDFALTERFYVLGGNPLRIRYRELVKTLLGASTLLRAVTPNTNAPGLLHLIPRDPSAPVRSVRLPSPAFVVHFANAFERDGAVIVDAAVFHRFEFGDEFGYTGPTTPFNPALPDARGPQALYRITVPPGATEATWARLAPHGVDFPRIHPHHHGLDTPVMFGATRADTAFSDPFDSVSRVDLHDRSRPPALWTVAPHQFVGEPMYVPGEGGGGFVLALVSDGLAERTTLVVLDAEDLAAGPVAEVRVPLLPVAFHGEWVREGDEGGGLGAL